jgi:hypothetical protein
VTSFPDWASLIAKRPPIAPAPTTHIFIITPKKMRSSYKSILFATSPKTTFIKYPALYSPIYQYFQSLLRQVDHP